MEVTFALPGVHPKQGAITWFSYPPFQSLLASLPSAYELECISLDIIQSKPFLLYTRVLMARELGKCPQLLTQINRGTHSYVYNI